MILTEGNTKNTKNTVIQRKYKKCSILLPQEQMRGQNT